MFECKFCGKIFAKESSLLSHIRTSSAKEKNKVHPSLVCYLVQHADRPEISKANLKKMYFDESKSTPMIAKELGINKPLLLKIMHFHGIQMRNLSKATKNQIKRDGLWNKGKTKYDHPAILSYSKSRRGQNNPYYTAPGYEERHRKNKERFLGIHRKECHNCNPKTTEGRMKKILDEAKIQFAHHFFVKYKETWRIFDFLIEGTLIIEMQGDYYHANPKMYGPDDIITVSKKKRKAKDIWEYDEDKAQLARQMGYNFIAIWEDDFCGMTDSDVVMLCKKNMKLING